MGRSLLLALLLAAAVSAEEIAVRPDLPNTVAFPATKARFVRFVIHRTTGSQPCIDELEVYAPGGEQNLALASAGAKATASSCLPGYAIHQVAHLNDGRYGNSQSWIAATSTGEWAQIELAGETAVDRVVFSRDRQGQYRDRLAVHFEVRLSLDGAAWQSVSTVKAVAAGVAAAARPPSPQSAGPLDTSDAALARALEQGDLTRYAFLCEARTCWRVDPTDPAKRVLGQLAQMIDRFQSRGIEVDRERSELAALVHRREQIGADPDAASALFFDARNAKRDLFFRDPDLNPLERILFVHRHPYNPSHNYSVILDAQGPAGGAVCLLDPAQVSCLYNWLSGSATGVTLEWIYSKFAVAPGASWLAPSRFLCLERRSPQIPRGAHHLQGLRTVQLDVRLRGQVVLLASLLLASAGPQFRQPHGEECRCPPHELLAEHGSVGAPARRGAIPV